MLAEDENKILSEIAREDVKRALRIESEMAAQRGKLGVAFLHLLHEPEPPPEPEAIVRLIAQCTERPMRYSPGPYVAPDGPDSPQRAAHIAWLLRRRQREEFRLDLRYRLAIEGRTRPKIGRFTVLDLTTGVCKFAVRDEPILFCGAACDDGHSYCAEHHALCHRMPWERR